VSPVTLPLFTVATLRMTAGIMAWAAHFGVIYAFTALACARGFTQFVPAAIAGATLVALAAIAIGAGPALRGRSRPGFERTLTRGIAALAAVAILLQALPVLLVPTC
jgi:hypothetical protein